MSKVWDPLPLVGTSKTDFFVGGGFSKSTWNGPLHIFGWGPPPPPQILNNKLGLASDLPLGLCPMCFLSFLVTPSMSSNSHILWQLLVGNVISIFTSSCNFLLCTNSDNSGWFLRPICNSLLCTKYSDWILRPPCNYFCVLSTLTESSDHHVIISVYWVHWLNPQTNM